MEGQCPSSGPPPLFEVAWVTDASPGGAGSQGQGALSGDRPPEQVGHVQCVAMSAVKMSKRRNLQGGLGS